LPRPPMASPSPPPSAGVGLSRNSVRTKRAVSPFAAAVEGTIRTLATDGGTERDRVVAKEASNVDGQPRGGSVEAGATNSDVRDPSYFPRGRLGRAVPSVTKGPNFFPAANESHPSPHAAFAIRPSRRVAEKGSGVGLVTAVAGNGPLILNGMVGMKPSPVPHSPAGPASEPERERERVGKIPSSWGRRLWKIGLLSSLAGAWPAIGDTRRREKIHLEEEVSEKKRALVHFFYCQRERNRSRSLSPRSATVSGHPFHMSLGECNKTPLSFHPVVFLRIVNVMLPLLLRR